MKQYGLIGKTLKHSFSKKYFTEKFAKEKINSTYQLFELPTIKDFLSIRKIEHLSGLNVTIPYKEKVIPYLDKIDPIAKKIGAVNTIQFVRKNSNQLSLKGYNTDMIGFINSIKPRLKKWHTKALILGTGGAGKAINYGLKQLNIEKKFVSRTPSANHFSYNQLDSEIFNDFQLIINTSPVGMFPNIEEYPPIPYHLLNKEHLLFDAIYNPAKTRFLQKGEEQGAEILNGIEMLINQAEESWKIWNQ